MSPSMPPCTPYKIPFYLIANIGTYLHCVSCQQFPRHLILAQVIAQRPDVIPTLKHMRQSGVRFILDNGAYEGDLFPSKEYLHLARELKPDVIVLPDLIGARGMDSLAVSMAFMDQIRNTCGDWGANVECMIVPQGVDIDDNANAFVAACEKVPTDKCIIGLGKSYLLWKREGADTPNDQRDYMIHSIMSLAGTRRHRFHILGARHGEVSDFDKYRNIIGVDTYKPCRAALQGVPIGRMDPKKTVPHTDDQVADSSLLTMNIHAFGRQWGAHTEALPLGRARKVRPQ